MTEREWEFEFWHTGLTDAGLCGWCFVGDDDYFTQTFTTKNWPEWDFLPTCDHSQVHSRRKGVCHMELQKLTEVGAGSQDLEVGCRGTLLNLQISFFYLFIYHFLRRKVTEKWGVLVTVPVECHRSSLPLVSLVLRGCPVGVLFEGGGTLPPTVEKTDVTDG